MCTSNRDDCKLENTVKQSRFKHLGELHKEWTEAGVTTLRLWRVIRSLLGREDNLITAPSIAHVPLMKMGPHDDPEAFVDLFEKTAEACSWARTHWPVHLKIWNPEQHRQRFRSVELGDNVRPFVMTQQLRDACRKWLMAEPRDIEEVIDRVVLEQFIARLPRRTAEWVQYHRPTSLTQAIQLAEYHLVACPGVGEPLINLSLAPSPPSFPSLARPVPAPRSRVPAAPRAPQRSGNGQGDRYPRRGGEQSRCATAFFLSPTIPCPSFCRWGGGKAWAGLLELRGPGAFSGPLSHDGGGIADPGPRLPRGCPDQAGQYQIPMSIKGGTYQALVDSGCNQTSIHQSLMQQRGRWIRAARLRWGVCTGRWRTTP